MLPRFGAARERHARFFHKQERSHIKTKYFELKNFWSLVVVMIGVETWKTKLSRLFWRRNNAA